MQCTASEWSGVGVEQHRCTLFMEPSCTTPSLTAIRAMVCKRATKKEVHGQLWSCMLSFFNHTNGGMELPLSKPLSTLMPDLNWASHVLGYCEVQTNWSVHYASDAIEGLGVIWFSAERRLQSRQGCSRWRWGWSHAPGPPGTPTCGCGRLPLSLSTCNNASKHKHITKQRDRDNKFTCRLMMY